MNIIEAIVSELQHEAATTRKMLEAVPPDSFDWKPHERSRTLREITSHIANIPGVFIAHLDRDEFDRNDYRSPADEGSDLLETFDENVSKALQTLRTQSEERLLASWRYRYGEQVIFELPRFAVIRAMALNHMIHHRGQLSVYLRLLDVPLPAVYGPTADEPLRPSAA